MNESESLKDFTIKESVYSDSSTTAAQGRIENTLSFSLKKKYGIENKDILNEILKIHGLSKDSFDVVSRAEKCLSEGLNDTSYDANANKTGKSIVGLINETITVPYSKMLGYRELYRKMKELYGKQEAKRLSGEMYDLSLGLNDSSKIMIPYCFSYDFSKMVINGRQWGQLPSKPPKRISSYVSALDETCHELSVATAGAVAVATFFMDIAHIIIFNEKKSLFYVKHNKKYRKYIENCMQTFVHSINHRSRNGVESPFTNLSIMDKEKYNGILKDDNMGWYFKDSKWSKEKIIDLIMELQNIFMDFFEKGDPLHGGRQYRFPVTSISITKDENGNILDKDFIKNISNREIFRYNIMVSKAGKFSQCCRLIEDADMFELGGDVTSLGMNQISLGSHRVVNINFNRIALEANKDKEKFYSILNERAESAAKILKAHKILLSDLEKKGYEPFITNGYIKFDRLFSTFGIAGILEAVKNMEMDNKDGIKEILIVLNKLAKDLSAKYQININIEFTPSESFAVRLHDADKLIFNKDPSDTPLYANQLCSLWEDHSIWERMKIDGEICKSFTGGSITHFTVQDKPTASQIKIIIEDAIKTGNEFFAINCTYSECEKGHNNFGNYNICPICGSKITHHFTRVVGFFTEVESWNKVRRNWDFSHRKSCNLKEKEYA